MKNPVNSIKSSAFVVILSCLISINAPAKASADDLAPTDMWHTSNEEPAPNRPLKFFSESQEPFEIAHFLGYSGKLYFKTVTKTRTYDAITFLGDSVMLSAIGEAYPINENAFKDLMAPYTRKLIIDTKISRQFTGSDELVRTLGEQGKLGEVLVLGLGTNGAWELEKSIEGAIAAANEYLVSQILLVNTRCPITPSMVNRELSKAAERHDNVELIDWNAVSASTTNYFSDECHVQYRSTSLSSGVAAYQMLFNNWFIEQTEDVRRIDEQMTIAARTNTLIKLWWSPDIP